MNISFERTGGFAGMRMAFSIDLDSLALEDAAILQKLVKDADFFNLSEHLPAQGHADGFQYAICVQSEGKQRTLHVSDGSIPDKLQPLLNDLSGRARSQRRAS